MSLTTTHIIPETGYELCFVPIPKETSGYKIETSTLIFDIKHGLDKVFEPLPDIGFALLSTLSEITEEKLEGIMPIHIVKGNYRDYTDKHNGFSSRTESLKSLMDFLKCYTVNPYGELYKAIRSGTARSKDGAEKDRGHIVHLVGNNDYPSWQTAICGIHPRGNGWHYYTDGQEVSCERCLAKSVGFIEAQSRTFADFAILVRTVNK